MRFLSPVQVSTPRSAFSVSSAHKTRRRGEQAAAFVLALLALFTTAQAQSTDDVDESQTGLAWGLAVAILAVNILAAVLLWRAYVSYELEAAIKEQTKTELKARRASQSSILQGGNTVGGTPASWGNSHAYRMDSMRMLHPPLQTAFQN